MGFSKSSRGWQNSSIGLALSTVAVCDVLRHPDVKAGYGMFRSLAIIMQFPGAEARGAALSVTDREQVPRSCARQFGNIMITDADIVVPNNDHVRLKYIFVYVTEPSQRRSPFAPSILTHHWQAIPWDRVAAGAASAAVRGAGVHAAAVCGGGGQSIHHCQDRCPTQAGPQGLAVVMWDAFVALQC